MKRRMGLALALTAFGAVSALWAVETTPEQARIAARNWIGKSPDRMTAKFASSADRGVQTSKNAEGRALYHVVSLAGGGYVVASGDTKLPPVIAFSESGDLDLGDAGNPLLALLERDMERRVALVGGAAAASGLKMSQGGAASPFEDEWAELTGERTARANAGADVKGSSAKTSLSSL